MADLRTTDITDRRLRIAAELVDAQVGTKGDRRVDAGDLREMERVLATPNHGRALLPQEEALLHAELPRLHALIAAPSRPAGVRPFCTSLKMTALRDGDVQRCGRAVLRL